LELEILALRHQICVLQRGAKTRPRLTSADRLLWVILFPGLGRLAFGTGHRQTGDRDRLAPQRIPPILDLESAARQTRPSGGFSRGPQSDPTNQSGESRMVEIRERNAAKELASRRQRPRKFQPWLGL